MTQMIHAPVPPPWRLRVLAYAAITAALVVKAVPGDRRRMAVRLAVARSVRALPPAQHALVQDLYEAVVACQPLWWRGQIDCKERSLATVLATALAGRRCHLVLGARALPAAFHAWVMTVDGTHVGNGEAGGHDHPWTPVYTTA
ncbi:lasso peptide biosynthesis B2 protein [Streptomyces castrisilvae]|uniref:Lasso peptide biosynthesis B2 protein n=1 Tax=Streptomyces castrisilvae TaxID=3033811 RepID=A0ABY9HNH6_9ACTN|nr:lasso peptide biosynthesis B2 protein [Streptomyces sp. Mut1]WLQ35548.1 lasso peptide biosynthesis B2 protein [Streptomyces sp. Mut1]